jgi:MFS family permease
VSGNLWRLELVRTLYWMHFVSAVLVPFFTEWGGIGLAQIMGLNAWFMACTFVLEIPTGAIADHFGRKWSIALGAVVTACASLLYASVPDIRVFIVAEVFFALGYSLVSGADEALLYDSLVATDRVGEAGRRIARLHAAQLAGIVIGALGGSVIAAHWGVRAPVLCQTIPMATAALLAATLVEPTRPVPHARTITYRAVLLSGVRRLRADGRLRVLVGDLVLVGALVWTLVWLYQPLLMRVGVPRVWFGGVHAALCLVQIAVLRSLDPLASLVGGRARYLRVAAGLAAAAMLALARPAPVAATIVLLMVAAGFGLSRTPIGTTVVNAAVDGSVRATMLSTVSGLRTLAICIVCPVAGAVADRSLATAMAGLGGLTLAVALLSPLRERHVAE